MKKTSWTRSSALPLSCKMRGPILKNTVVRHQNLLRTGKCSNGPPYASATPEVAEVMATTQAQFIANGNQDMQTTAKPRVARGRSAPTLPRRNDGAGQRVERRIESRFATMKLALSERLRAAPDPSATLDLSEYYSLNCETVRPSHCSHGESKRRGTYSTLNCRQPPLSCCKSLGDVRFHH